MEPLDAVCSDPRPTSGSATAEGTPHGPRHLGISGTRAASQPMLPAIANRETMHPQIDLTPADTTPCACWPTRRADDRVHHAEPARIQAGAVFGSVAVASPNRRRLVLRCIVQSTDQPPSKSAHSRQHPIPHPYGRADRRMPPCGREDSSQCPTAIINGTRPPTRC